MTNSMIFRDMDDMLSAILAKAFIIPLSKVETDKIKKVVDAYLHEVDVDKLQLCGDVYFLRKRKDELQSALEECAVSLEQNFLDLSDLAYVALAEYILCTMVCSSAVSCKFRFLASMFIRNFLVLQKTESQIFNPEALKQTLKYASNYMEEQGTVNECEEYSLRPEIFNASKWSDIIASEESLSASHFDEIKTYALKAEKYDYMQTVISEKKNKYKDSFQKALAVAYRLSHVSSWLMVDSNPKATIKQIMSGNKTKKKMQSISLDTAELPCHNIQGHSSLLLDYMYHPLNRDVKLGQMEFTPTELAIYLYYEFLLEKLLREYGE